MSNDNNGGIQRPDGKVKAIDTDYQIGQDNIALKVGPFGLDIHNRVFAISGMFIILFVVFPPCAPFDHGAKIPCCFPSCLLPNVQPNHDKVINHINK